MVRTLINSREVLQQTSVIPQNSAVAEHVIAMNPHGMVLQVRETLQSEHFRNMTSIALSGHSPSFPSSSDETTRAVVRINGSTYCSYHLSVPVASPTGYAPPSFSAR